jgi:predicted TIM-barrel fold metal-dependent hydrolase
MIIDVHTHVGYDFSFDEVMPVEKIIAKIEKYDVLQIVQPGTTHNIAGARDQHDEIYKLSRKYPGKILGMAAPNPHSEEKQYNDEISRCVEDLGFVGIKMQTFAAAVHPNSEAGRRVFLAAQKHKVPILVHTGTGMPFASPINLVKVAGDFPDVKIIISHGGAIILADEVATAFSLCPNIFADTSWTPGYILLNWIKAYGKKLMFASDLPDNFETEYAKVTTYGFTEDEQKSILEDTAKEVFNIG